MQKMPRSGRNSHAIPHPYSGQPDKARWSRSVAKGNLGDVYQKKFEIKKEDRVSAAGSCFAQHIGRRLAQSGFNYQDFEPAPTMMAAQDRSRFGYGIFSARYGNIYTVRQMVQMFARAAGRIEVNEPVWNIDGRFFDPYRPNVEPEGFASSDEFEAISRSHFSALKKMLRNTDLLVFTLGLTEAWRSKYDGTVYPVCPGTVAGKFDPDKYEFINFSYSEIKEDLERLIRLFRKRNPSVKFILTVSPVPLAATATKNHVLVATAYSKAVLRAVAGDVAASDPLVDYFPSYEIVTNPANRSSFYAPDLREVPAEAVDKVMSYFFSEHPPVGAAREEEREPDQSKEDIVCEEAILDQ